MSDPDNEFEEQGVTFKIITEDIYPQVYTLLKKDFLKNEFKVADFMWLHFYPHEPVSRYFLRKKRSTNIIIVHKIPGDGETQLVDQ